MKKCLLIAIVLIASISLNNLVAQVNAGFKMGVDFSNLRMYTDDVNGNEELDTKRLISPRLGFILEIGINENLFIQTGVFGGTKGFRFDATDRIIDEKLTDTKEYEIIICFDMPVNFGYKYDLGGAKLFAMAGPVFSYNTYATLLYKYGDEWSNDHQTVGTEFEDFIKPFNFGVNIEAGVEVSRFQFTASYTNGLSDLSNFGGLVFNTNVLSLTAAVKFGNVDGGRGGYRH